MNRAVWQISGGPSSRSYTEVLLKHGVALIGPGDAGPWAPERDDDEFDGGFVRRFATEVAAGDVFLRALGWAPERIAVQWRCIDVAVFRALPRTPEKRLGAGVEGALDQAKGYVEALGVPRDVIVTDGIRYRMYAAARGFEPVAYANLARLKRPAAELFARVQRS